MTERGVAEQGAQRGQPGVAGGDGHAPIIFEVGEKSSDGRCLEVGEVQLGRKRAGGVGHVREQLPERVAVGGHRVGAGLALRDESLGEEGLQCWSDETHASTSVDASRRSPAKASSSGDPARVARVRNMAWTLSYLIRFPAG